MIDHDMYVHSFTKGILRCCHTQKGMIGLIISQISFEDFCRGVLCGDFCGLLRGDLQGVDKLVSALLYTLRRLPVKW